MGHLFQLPFPPNLLQVIVLGAISALLLLASFPQNGKPRLPDHRRALQASGIVLILFTVALIFHLLGRSGGSRSDVDVLVSTEAPLPLVPENGTDAEKVVALGKRSAALESALRKARADTVTDLKRELTARLAAIDAIIAAYQGRLVLNPDSHAPPVRDARNALAGSNDPEVLRQRIARLDAVQRDLSSFLRTNPPGRGGAP